MSADVAAAGVASEPLLDLQRIGAGIRWRRRVWTVGAVIGLTAGIAVGAFLPTRATASARIYVVHSDEGSGTSDGAMKTDLALLETTTIAVEAIDRLHVSQSPEQFVASYSGTVVAGNILEVTARDTDGPAAVARTQAVADAFIAVHVRQADDAAKAEVEALNQLRDNAQKELDAVNDQIKLLGAGDAAKQAALYDRRSSLSGQVSSLDQRAQEAGIGSPAVKAGTKIIDAAHVTSRSVLVSAGIYGAIGLLIGWGLGLAIAAVTTVARDRPVLRRDISANLGASVIAQLPAPVRGPRRLISRSRPEKERKLAAATLARVVREDAAGMSVLELGCPKVAAALAKDMAEEMAGERPVLLVDDLPGGQLTAIADALPPEVTLVAGGDFPPAVAPAGRVLAVGSVGPGAPWTDLRRLGAETLVVVRAGSTEAAWMHTVARQLADAGIAIIGLVVVHPDPRDRSDGTLWDALQTAVRGRGSARPVASTAEAVAQAAALAAVRAVAGNLPVAPGAAPAPAGPHHPAQPVRPPAYRPLAPAPSRIPLGTSLEATPTEAIAMGPSDDGTRALPVTRPAAAATNGHASPAQPGGEQTVALPVQRQNRNGSNGNGNNGANGNGANGNGANGTGAERDVPADQMHPQPDEPSAAGSSPGGEQGRVRGRPSPRFRPLVRPVPLDGHPTVKLPPVVRTTPADRPEAT